MVAELPENPRYRRTMDRLETIKRTAKDGSDYWMAREIKEILGYAKWQNFEGVLERARSAIVASGNNPSQHITEVGKMVAVGSGAKRRRTDYYLSRGACYLVAMNGDPAKPEIAAAQAYFAVQTRAREIEAQALSDEERVGVREKVKKSFRVVSGVAKVAGVGNTKQAIFHDARYQGLYGMSGRDLKDAKGIPAKENAFDRMGALELSAHDFQMNLAAETIKEEGVRGEIAAIHKNRELAKKVRQTMLDSGSRAPEELPIEEPIKHAEKRLKARKAIDRPPTS